MNSFCCSKSTEHIYAVCGTGCQIIITFAQIYWMLRSKRLNLWRCHQRQQPIGNAGNSFDSRNCVVMRHTRTPSNVAIRTKCVALLNLFVRESEVNRRTIVEVISRELNHIKSTVKWQTETFESGNSYLCSMLVCAAKAACAKHTN